jgi:mxaC protein
MNVAFENPTVLAALALVLLPLYSTGVNVKAYPWLELLPPDPLSLAFAGLLRLLGIFTLAALVLGLAGIYRKEQQVERIGYGAHIVIMFDRSNSMDNTFAGKTPSGEEESKTAAARRLLSGFVEQRKQEHIGFAGYSTSPLFIMPLTANKAAVKAAIGATSTPALAYTNISKGLALALSYFDNQPLTGSRVVFLVSDGAAAVDPDTELELRKQFKQQQVSLYWLFLRTANSPGIFDTPTDPRNDNADAMPERYLHLFFNSLNIPYHAYEAENPQAMQRAIDDINQLENKPLHYFENIPKQDLSDDCYRLAAALLAVLFGLKWLEVR